MSEQIEAPEGAELAALGAEATALDFDVGDMGPDPAAGPVAVVDPAAETAAMIGAAVGLLSPLLPYLPTIYTPDRIQGIAAAYVPVATKYGWNVGGWLEQYGAEIALIATAGPALLQTANAHKAWKAEREKEEREKEERKKPATQAAPVEVPPVAVVAFGGAGGAA